MLHTIHILINEYGFNIFNIKSNGGKELLPSNNLFNFKKQLKDVCRRYSFNYQRIIKDLALNEIE